MNAQDVNSAGQKRSFGMHGHPVAVAAIYVMPTSDEASHIFDPRYGVTGGKPSL